MMFATAVFYAALLAATTTSQPSVPATAATPEQFAPKGWRVLEKAVGDLNRDGMPDVAIVFKNPAEDRQGQFDVQRLLVVAFKKGAQFERSAFSFDEILCKTCGGVLGDPFQEIKIERNTVVISHYGGSRERWGHKYRYRLEPGGWMRIGETTVTEDTGTGFMREKDKNLITGRAEVTVERNEQRTSQMVNEAPAKKAAGWR
jgi:hypothetical protein